jgi:splicing factor 3B subunit 1
MAAGLMTPVGGMPLGLMTPEQTQALRVQTEIDERNRPLSDEELDAMFPQDGYKILEAPASCVVVLLFCFAVVGVRVCFICCFI